MRTPLVPRGATVRKPSLRNIPGVPNHRHSGTAAVLDQERVGAALSHERSLVSPVDSLPLIARRAAADGLRPLVEHAPTPSLFDRECLKTRKGPKAQLTHRVCHWDSDLGSLRLTIQAKA